MDLHAHVSMAEVIGLLGGRYSETDGIVEVCAAEPCNSLSTGLQCEMDPVSQTQARRYLLLEVTVSLDGTILILPLTLILPYVILIPRQNTRAIFPEVAQCL
uniref:Uncharacterized protein n=1 Tax=Micrurus spixii TaxID=129469 RepID=A0A2D4MXH5_9SAUR